jgi:hypothetical protein
MKERRGELIKLSALFDKYIKTLKAPQKTVEKAARVAIFEVTGLQLVDAQIKYTVSTQTLFVNAPSIMRTEIKIKNEEILRALQVVLGKNQSEVTLL